MTDDALPFDAGSRFARLAGTITLRTPDAELHRRLVGMFAGRRATAGVAANFSTVVRRRVIALLAPVAGVGGAIAGARGAGGRHAVFTSEQADLSLQLRDVPDGVRIDGLVLPVDGEDRPYLVRVEAIEALPAIASAAHAAAGSVRANADDAATTGRTDTREVLQTNDFGEFRVVLPARGAVRLIVEMPDHDLVAGPIELAA